MITINEADRIEIYRELESRLKEKPYIINISIFDCGYDKYEKNVLEQIANKNSLTNSPHTDQIKFEKHPEKCYSPIHVKIFSDKVLAEYGTDTYCEKSPNNMTLFDLVIGMINRCLYNFWS